jgi:Na+/melibiose symporter-like transporter
VGIVTYSLFMSEWKYRRLFLVTNLLYIAVSSTNILFFRRLNVKMGIPDTVFVIGTEALQVITGVWSSMPASVMMLQLCPRGVESTVYALLAGSANLGMSLANYQGAYVLDALGIKPNATAGESHQFDNLWIAALIATLLPLIPLVTIPFLIPDASQTDRLLDDCHGEEFVPYEEL